MASVSNRLGTMTGVFALVLGNMSSMSERIASVPDRMAPVRDNIAGMTGRIGLMCGDIAPLSADKIVLQPCKTPMSHGRTAVRDDMVPVLDGFGAWTVSREP